MELYEMIFTYYFYSENDNDIQYAYWYLNI